MSNSTEENLINNGLTKNISEPRRIVFSLGSNQGDSLDILRTAIDRLAATPGLRVVDVAPVYETTPVGNVNQPNFFNTVVLALSSLKPMVILEIALEIEQDFGRVRDPNNPHGPRTLDIDLIVIGEEKSDAQALQLPHPRAHERAFVLIPWRDIDSQAKLPQGAIADLISQLDTSGVKRLIPLDCK